MAGAGVEINAPKKRQGIASFFGGLTKAQSSPSPTRKSDSSLLQNCQGSSTQSGSHYPARLWCSLKKFSSSAASDISRRAPTNWSIFSGSYQVPAETPAQSQTVTPAQPQTVTPAQPQTETNQKTCNSSTSTQSLNPPVPEEKDVDQIVPPESNTIQVVVDFKKVSYSPSTSSKAGNVGTTWHVTPATPETASTGGTPLESPDSPQSLFDESPQPPAFDWSSLDWDEGESDPPRGLLFPFPIRPISRSESCQSVIMGSTGSHIEFEY